MSQLNYYLKLMRVDKPIGFALLFWPTLWALWVAGQGKPSWFIVGIFFIGAYLMRAAGCVINDIADRNIDKHVARTKQRPLTAGQVSVKSALILFMLLIGLSFVCVLFLNRYCLWLAFIGFAITCIYPFCKRFFVMPQFILGQAFAWGIVMAFAAINNHLSLTTWLMYFAAMCWIIAYDTQYAMADKADDLKVGIHTSAILFGKFDKLLIGLLQVATLILLVMVGAMSHLSGYFYVVLAFTSGFFFYQQKLIKDREPKKCFQAFLNNNGFGLMVFVAMVLGYWH